MQPEPKSQVLPASFWYFRDKTAPRGGKKENVGSPNHEPGRGNEKYQKRLNKVEISKISSSVVQTQFLERPIHG